MKARGPGALVQLDSMRRTFTEGVSLKACKASCPISKWSGMRGYRWASSRHAKDFWDRLLKQAPVVIRSCQVDGGREVREAVEQACRDLGIDRYGLPPRKPKDNGGVERANGTSRYECSPVYQGALRVGAINQQLAEYQHDDTTYRPHDGIG